MLCLQLRHWNSNIKTIVFIVLVRPLLDSSNILVLWLSSSQLGITKVITTCGSVQKVELVITHYSVATGQRQWVGQTKVSWGIIKFWACWTARVIAIITTAPKKFSKMVAKNFSKSGREANDDKLVLAKIFCQNFENLRHKILGARQKTVGGQLLILMWLMLDLISLPNLFKF